LSELYFLDPEWLCALMAHIITVREMNPFISPEGVSGRARECSGGDREGECEGVSRSVVGVSGSGIMFIIDNTASLGSQYKFLS